MEAFGCQRLLPSGAFQPTHAARFCLTLGSGPGGVGGSESCRYQYIAKLNPAGTALWATYVTGTYGAVTPGVFQPAYAAAASPFPAPPGSTYSGPPPASGYVTKVSAGGTALIWSTYFGGTYGAGTVFKITSRGTMSTVYSFCPQNNCPDGGDPDAGLVQATDGNLYGTTVAGGAYNAGTIFKITLGGMLTTLYSFCSQSDCSDGEQPIAGLVQATDGNFYGTTHGGGANYLGTVFKITPGGTLTSLYSFCSQSGCADGQWPFAGLVQATDGNFYGATIGGGAYNVGTIFKITPSGTLTTLHSFTGSDGAEPWAAPVQASDGNFYGTTGYGGVNGAGTVFRLVTLRPCIVCPSLE